MAENSTAGTGATWQDIRRVIYSVGRLLLLVGVIACAVGTLVYPIETGFRPDAWLVMSGITRRAGAQLVGWGAILVALARLNEVLAWSRRLDTDVPGLRSDSGVSD